ncbi:hypothetical protein [Amphritea pacifica]|uniref:hypothetical protein n=1 Tax=Amphritea pacifica TaxID=2811233 RepID=UPI00196540C4|nr:hypothetical protein [Amphritea pacifica]MBN1008312.1 hypothetical protein [Amphritea pacifica]
MELEDNPHLLVKNGVVQMTDGTLFLRQKLGAQRQFDYLQKKLEVTQDFMTSFNRNVEMSQAYCSNKNISYLHVIFPAKPVAFRKRFESIGVHISPIVNEFYLSNLNVYYPRLEEIREDWFIKDNTHCSYLGYFSVIKDVVARVGVNISGYSYTLHEKEVLGDLGRMIGSSPLSSKYIK